ncbi:MAG: glycosyltransferase family 4 protein [Desulforhopalus sp.]
MLTTSFPVKEGASSGVFVERLAKKLALKSDVYVLAPAADILFEKKNERSYQLFTFRYAPMKWQVLAHGGGGIPAILASRPITLLLLPVFLVSMLMHSILYVRKVDLIFANWSICGLIAGIAGFATGKPVITTIRGEDGNRAKYSRVHRLVMNLCLRLNKRIVTVSDDIAMSLSRQFPSMEQKIVMIPNGVDLISTKSRANEHTQKKEVKLVIVGSLIPRKDVSTALKALSLLPLWFKLTIIGDGPDRKYLVSLSRELHLQSRVRFEGHVTPEEIPSYLGNSDVFLITSKSEGRPNALLEACASGLPTVGSDIPGVREIIISDVNGVLFPVGDHEALAHRLLPFSDLSLRHQLGNSGRRLIEERGLTWENTADQYIQEFRKYCG